MSQAKNAITIKQLVDAIEGQLMPEQFSDYCPNGLQVQGANTIKTLVTGVTASQALIDEAVKLKADALLVHHGYFWKGEDARLTGMKYQRIKTLMDNDINLLAYHLPLDAHPVLGNNAQLAELLGLSVEGGLQPGEARPVGNVGSLNPPMSAADFSQRVKTVLKREPLLIGAADATISRVAWCTGAAQGYIEQAVAAGADLFLSGEISEPTVHSARELGIHYMAAGHHATERYGVKALGEWLANELGLTHHFVDIDNPV
ncbi:Nif3-like dinuclear metal center hexameric protein [Dasania sp. GY-MA-18]|uniref:GTP cyclohydrolase 1 type 2 homolog n=1 Tax=Dasania phycosphaerae TaxID=2950436 RepID=A0A9J6RH42_9GAMM|nr:MULTISPECIES: Nif3-like dinuclear metal center hexameric protein [Dasania]MCR8921554.1 Nif3-like dinuclear metal center hexameric protein [Dasania sp. GY-MA-18]MCZ0863982.1 Nif3-like dinuclear metal center hexameric protein [Dasania phycosphaerae]MCZ0867710.1 Nif3-like dinuclear metal center hexameric protein [Dasania phycosphaerae]